MNNCPICDSKEIKNNSAGLKLCNGCGVYFFGRQDFAEPLYNGKETDVYNKSKIKLFNYGLKVLNSCFPQKGRLLDIGAAYGDFIKLAKKAGWQVEGVELSDKMVQDDRQKGLTMYNKPIEDLDLKSNSYEAITAYEVFSQMKTTRKAVLEIYKILKPQGVLIIREFNSTFHIKLLGLLNMKPFSFLNLQPGITHNFNFNKRSLEALLKKAGFKDIKIVNSRSTMGDPYGTGGKLGSVFVSVFKTMYYILSQGIYYLSFGGLCVGSSLVVVARK